jgi:hypothetical protein
MFYGTQHRSYHTPQPHSSKYCGIWLISFACNSTPSTCIQLTCCNIYLAMSTSCRMCLQSPFHTFKLKPSRFRAERAGGKRLPEDRVSQITQKQNDKAAVEDRRVRERPDSVCQGPSSCYGTTAPDVRTPSTESSLRTPLNRLTHGELQRVIACKAHQTWRLASTLLHTYLHTQVQPG